MWSYIQLLSVVSRDCKSKSKLRSRIDVTTMCLALQDLRCPYCRSLQKKLLPYREMKGVEEKWGVNAPERHVMMASKCKYVFLGKKKDSVYVNHVMESTVSIMLVL